MNKSKIGIELMVGASVLVSVGQLFWKLSQGNKIGLLCLGFFLYSVGALMMIYAYRFGKLSVLQPILSLSYVFAIVLGYYVFNDKITTGKLVSISLIIGGVLVISHDR